MPTGIKTIVGRGDGHSFAATESMIAETWKTCSSERMIKVIFRVTAVTQTSSLALVLSSPEQVLPTSPDYWGQDYTRVLCPIEIESFVSI